MLFHTRALALFLLLFLAGLIVLPEPADARSRQRRNYAEEMREDDRRDKEREEREKARQDYLDAQEEQQQRYIDAAQDRQNSHQQHRERQLDRVLDTWEGKPRPASPAPVRPSHTGTCMYGADGKVIYQPKGAVCNH